MEHYIEADPTRTVESILVGLRGRGVRFWSAEGRLHYRAPKGALSSEDLEAIRRCSSQLATILRDTTPSAEAHASSPIVNVLNTAPLTFSQSVYCRECRLTERRTFRQIASAIRIDGNLNTPLLEKSVFKTIARHDALRTKIKVVDGKPIQEIARSAEFSLRIEDIADFAPELQLAEVHRQIDNLILEPIDVSVGPLFALKLLKLSKQDHVLIVAMEHVISDAYSLGVLLNDLFTTYSQLLKGSTVTLAQIALQLADYAAWQQSMQSTWLEEHGTYWSERLSDCPWLRFPTTQFSDSRNSTDWGVAEVRIDHVLTSELREWCRMRKTTPVMAVLTAYFASLLSWCNVPEGVIQYVTDGRVRPEVANTIGFIASDIYLGVHLHEEDTFDDLLKSVTSEYCNAYEHVDYCSPGSDKGEESPRCASFNWIPRKDPQKLGTLGELENQISLSSLPFKNPALGLVDPINEPAMLLYDTAVEVSGGLYFPLNRFSAARMEEFVRLFQRSLETLLGNPGTRVRRALRSH